MVDGALRVGVVGIEHLHLFEMIDGLVGVGAETVCHSGEGPLADLYEGWRTSSVARSSGEVIGDDSLDLVVTAAVPAERASIAVAALGAGRHVLAAKPAALSRTELGAVDRAAITAGRRWWVFFSERLTNRAVIEAVRIVGAGEIGEPVAITGIAPHTLAPESRPEWFFDPARSGGILVDLAAHQADQLLALAGPGETEVESAHVANVANPRYPGTQDLGRMSLRHRRHDGRVVISDHRVDWLSPAGLGTWGDVRLLVTGSAGSLEVRSNIDVGGAAGPEHLFVVDATGARRVDCSGTIVDWAGRLRADIELGTDSFMAHDHAVAACAIALDGQRVADGCR